MKTVTVVLLVAGFASGWVAMDLIRAEFKSGAQQQEDRIVNAVDKKLEEKLEDVYEAVALNNVTQNNILDNHGRLLHYIAGHNSGKFILYCPECGLLEQLAIRKHKIDDRIVELSEFIQKNPEDSTVPEKTKEIQELTQEANLATQKIFVADERAKELSKLMTNVKSE